MVKKQQKTAATTQAQGRRKAASPTSGTSPASGRSGRSRRARASSTPAAADTPFAEQVRTSAQQIWSAGLAAFAKSQERDLASVDRSGPAPDTAARRLSDLAGEVGSRAGQHWDKLESIFEDRVARALERLGMPAAGELAQLKSRLQALEAEVAMLRAAQGGVGRKPAAKTAAQATKAAKSAKGGKAASSAKGGRRTT